MRKDKIKQMSSELGNKNLNENATSTSQLKARSASSSQNSLNTVEKPEPKFHQVSCLPTEEENLPLNKTSQQPQNRCDLPILQKNHEENKELVIDLENLDEEQIRLINQMLDSKLNQLSGSKPMVTKNECQKVCSYSGEPTTMKNAHHDSDNLRSPRSLLNQSSSFEEESPKSKSMHEERAESFRSQGLDSGQMTPMPEVIDIKKQEKDSHNISQDFMGQMSDASSKNAEIDRVYEEKLREYLSIRDRMLNSLNDQQSIRHQLVDIVKENSSQAKLLTNKNHHHYSEMLMREGRASISNENQQQSTQSLKTEDSRVTASFSNAVTPVDSGRNQHLPSSTHSQKFEESLRSESQSVRSMTYSKTEISNSTLQNIGNMKKQSPQIPEEADLINLNDDFYDDQLFDIVSELESVPASSKNNSILYSVSKESMHFDLLNSESKYSERKKSKIDEEFLELVSTVIYFLLCNLIYIKMIG